jgi:hypothetical protein
MGRKALSMSIGDDHTQSAAWLLVGGCLASRGQESGGGGGTRTLQSAGHALSDSPGNEAFDHSAWVFHGLPDVSHQVICK